MPYYPTLPEAGRDKQTVDVFSGYNHNLKINDGQLYDMKNLSGDAYPLLSTRRKRGIRQTVGSSYIEAPQGLMGKSELVLLNGSQLWYGSRNCAVDLAAVGLSISTDSSMLPKKLVSLGAYVCIFPDKLYINTENFSQCGAMEAKSITEASDDTPVMFSICKADGTAYATPTVSETAPASPANGDLWIDTSGMSHMLKEYSSVSAQWLSVPTVYTKIAAAGIGTGFRRLDGVIISGCGIGTVLGPEEGPVIEGEQIHYYGAAAIPVFGGGPGGTTIGSGANTSAVSQVNTQFPQISDLNGCKIIYDRGDDYIVVVGLLDSPQKQTSGTVTVERKVPDMDFITEAQNRLWGCKYGVVDGATVNEIYCCALGDPTNWNQFLGLSTDSYVASLGTDGPFTGAVTHMSCPLFFKENHLHKVYVSSSGAHQITDTACRGVQQGSHRSLQVVNEILYYKSRNDVCAYDGSLPVSVSAALGTGKYSDAAAGAMGDKYYISMKDSSDAWHMFVLDTARGFWHREDGTQALHFAALKGELYYITALADGTYTLAAVNGSVGTPEDEVDWEAVTGIYGTDYAQHKYVGRLNLRMQLPVGSRADVYIQYDSDGVWRHSGHMDGVGTGSFTLPIRPRRCDHFRLRLCGAGEMKLFSVTKYLERGSDE